MDHVFLNESFTTEDLYCRESWIGDGVCDDICLHYCECANDYDDCYNTNINDYCSPETACGHLWQM